MTARETRYAVIANLTGTGGDARRVMYELPLRAPIPGQRRGTIGTREHADRVRVARAIAARDYSLTVGTREAWSADRIARIAARNAFLAAR